MLDSLDLELMQREFEQLWFANHEYAYRYAYHITRNPDTAQEIVQEASVRAWVAFSNGKFVPERTKYPNDPPRAFRVWFLRIVHNLCMDELKLIARMAVVSLDDAIGVEEDSQSLGEIIPSFECPIHESIEAEEFVELVRRAVNGLPSPYRETFRLLLKGKTYEQIAEILQIELGTVRSRISRARKLILQFFENHYPEYIEN